MFFRVFYRLDYKGLENIPTNKAVVLAPNHVNGFIDPMTIAILTKQKIRFFARGDVFKKKLAKIILNDFSISPVYRIQEGFAEIKKNNKTFEECRKRLSNNETILMFPEAICVQERRLRPLKKGLSRIVFQSEELFDFKKDIVIIPLGINYSAPYKFRSKLFVDFGEPLSIKSYESKYKQDKVKAINEFTKDLENIMRKHLVIVNNSHYDKLLEGLEEIYLHQWIKEKKHNVKNLQHHYLATKELAEMINVVEEKNPDLIHSLNENVKKYIQLMHKNKLRDHLLRSENIEKNNIGTFIFNYLFIWLFTPVYAIALLLNYLPYFVSKKISDKKIKQIEFYASIYSNLAMLLWGIFYAIQILTIALVFKNWLFLSVYALAVPLLGFFAIWFYPRKQKIIGNWQLLRMVRKERTTVENLVSSRSIILNELHIAKEEYLKYKK